MEKKANYFRTQPIRHATRRESIKEDNKSFRNLATGKHILKAFPYSPTTHNVFYGNTLAAFSKPNLNLNKVTTLFDNKSVSFISSVLSLPDMDWELERV